MSVHWQATGILTCLSTDLKPMTNYVDGVILDQSNVGMILREIDTGKTFQWSGSGWVYLGSGQVQLSCGIVQR